MPFPDRIIFGKRLTDNSGISFGEVRQVVDETEKLALLKRRIESYLIEQTDPIAEQKIYGPFPLTVLTCVASETLGRIIEPVEAYEQESRKRLEIPKIVSVRVYGMLDKKLTRPLSQENKEAMKKIWPEDDVKSISSYSELFHSYLRTSFIHGYRSKNVFLTEETSSWVFEEGSFFLNPYWFWATYRNTFNDCFNEILSNKEKNNPLRKNALDYFNRLINQ